MSLQGKKVGILFEADYYEREIFYYDHRFQEEGIEYHWLTRLWGQPSITFTGHDFKIPMECHESFENMDDATLRSFSAIIVPSGMVSDRLRYTEDVHKIPPATEFLRRAFAEKSILKGIICHGMWLVAPAPELIRGRRQARGPDPDLDPFRRLRRDDRVDGGTQALMTIVPAM
jgi:protease I